MLTPARSKSSLAPFLVCRWVFSVRDEKKVKSRLDPAKAVARLLNSLGKASYVLTEAAKVDGQFQKENVESGLTKSKQ